MKYITQMQNLTEGALSRDCLNAYPQEPHKCFMAPYVQKFVKTPFFMFNSKYDVWQMKNILKLPCYQFNTPCSSGEQKEVMSYGIDFMKQFEPVREEHGAAISTCICHVCRWDTLTMSAESNMTAIDHYIAWFNGKTSGTGSIHVDKRTPNGDGTLKIGCAHFP